MSDRPFCYFWVFLSNFEYIGLFWGIPDYFWPFLALLLWQICTRLQAEESEAARPARGGEERCGGGRCKTEVKASFRPTLRVSRGPFVARAMRGKAVNASFPPLHSPRDRLSSSCV